MSNIEKVVSAHAIQSALDDLATRVLRDSKMLEAADELDRAVIGFIARCRTHGPFDADMEVTRLIKASKEYREVRGIDLERMP